MQGIEIPIGAPLGQLDKDLKNATNKISNFADTTLGKFAILNKTKFTFGQNFISEADKLASKGKGLGDNLSGPLVKGSNSAAFALTNLGRVAQDAPFGFIGIQNNLNPLLESFSRLKSETGSTSTAFKALGQSLIGPAGLGIALSVVSAAILFYQQYQQRANKETKVAADANKELADSIKTLGQVQAEGRSNASKDLSQLQSLYNATQNANIPTKERLKIANDLIKRYPEYLKGLSAEEILAGKAASAYNSLTNAILAKGYAQAAEENRQKLINQQLNAKVELTKEQIKLDKASSELAKRTAQKQATLDIQGQAALEKGISRTANAVDDSRNKINELNNTYKNAANEIKILDNVTQGLIKTFGAEVVIDPEKVKKSNDNLKTQSDILKQLDIDFKQIAADFSITFGKGNEERVGALKKAINELISIGFTKDSGIVKQLQNQLLAIDPSQVEAKGKELGVNAAKGISEGLASAGPVITQNINKPLKQGLTDWQLYVNDTLLPQIENNFKTFFDNILMNGKISFDSLGKALLNTLLSIIASDAARQVTNLFKTSKGTDYSDSKGKGGIFSAIGGLLKIGGGKAAAGAAATTAGAGGAGALATGTAATGGALLPILAGVAAVAGIASLFKKKPKAQAPLPQASSTISTSAAGSAQDFGGGRVVFEISGTNLIGVLNRAGAKLQRYGG
jgi:hypothetical protein